MSASPPRRLTADAAVVLVGDVLARAGMFAAFVWLARTLALSEFARFGVAMAVVLVGTSLLDSGVGVVLTVRGAAEGQALRPLVRASATMRTPLLLAFAGVCMVVGLAEGRLHLAVAIIACAAVNAVQQTLFAVFRSARRFGVEAMAKAGCGASYPLACALATSLGHGSAVTALVALTVGPAVSLVPLTRLGRSLLSTSPMVTNAWMLARQAVPFGGIALATLLYYRTPLLLMGILASHRQTASYSVASNVAFGLLMLPAAFATSLLPRLSGEPCAAARVDLARAVQRRCFGATAAGAGIVAAASPWLLPFVFGARFAQLGPLWILLATAPMIGVAGVLGALLIAEDRRSGLAAQVLSALTLNALVSLVLITSFGAVGAALATFLTEGYSLLLLALLVRHSARVPATQPAQTSPVYAR